MKKILVTGGSGFIGSALSRHLLDLGYEVKIFDNFSRGKEFYIDDFKEKITLIDGDIRDKKIVQHAVENCDIVIHLAAINGTRFFYEIPEQVLDVNIRGTMNILEICAELKIKKFMFGSSSEVYGYPNRFPTKEDHVLQIDDSTNPRFSYSGSKILGEILVANFAKKFNFAYTILRFHNIYGPMMGNEHVIPEFIRRIVRDEEFTVQGDGNQIRSFCYISDAVNGIELAISQNGDNEIFNIGNDKMTTINELIKELSSVSKKDISPKYDLSSEFLHGSTKKRQPDITHAREKLGYEPKVELSEGLAKTYEWYQDYYKQNQEMQ